MHADVLDLELQRAAGVEPRADQVLDHLLLAVDRDRAAAGERREVDPVAAAVEPQLDPVVHEALALHPLADPGLGEQLDRAVLEHARPDPLLDVLAAADLEHDGLDPVAVEQVRQQQPRRPRADDPDLRPMLSDNAGHPTCRARAAPRPAASVGTSIASRNTSGAVQPPDASRRIPTTSGPAAATR